MKKFIERYKDEREVKDLLIENLNHEIRTKAFSKETDVKEMYDLWEKKQTVKMNGLGMNDVAKIAANVIVVGVIIGFEMSHVMNKTATKFIRPL